MISGIKLNILALISTAFCLFLLASGCARFPANNTQVTGKQIIVTMTVAGQINTNYHYYVAFDTSGQPAPGPLPVVGPPWGNGWGTGNITSYVVFDANQPQGGYGVFRMVPGTNLLNNVYVGPPVSSSIPPQGANRLQFTIDLGQLATPTTTVDQIDIVNVNFITTDVVPIDPNFPGPKFFDGLGPSGSDFVQISIKNNQGNNNARTPIESAGDVRVPDLDIIDWSIEVRG